MSRSAAALRVVDFSEHAMPRLSVGDLVRTGDSRFPLYEIIAIAGGQAWIRDIQYCTDNVVPIDHLKEVDF